MHAPSPSVAYVPCAQGVQAAVPPALAVPGRHTAHIGAGAGIPVTPEPTGHCACDTVTRNKAQRPKSLRFLAVLDIVGNV